MKNSVLIILVSIISSFLTILFYTTFLEKDTTPKAINVNDVAHAKYTSNSTPITRQSSYTSSAPTSFTRAAEKSAPAVVHISSIYSNFGGRSMFDDLWGRREAEASSGSGVIISSDGYVVTNNHVIEDGDRLKVTLQDKRSYDANVVGTDPSTDLALLKLDTEEEGLPFLTLADSDSSKIGEWVLAVGNPFNLTSTVTAGIVSAKGRNIDILDGDYSIESFIQTDAAVNPGNSGGALVNTRGDLVGINTAIITRSGRYEGYSFAVPSNLVQKVIADLKEFGIVQRGFLGVNIRDVTDEIAQDLNLDTREGVYITVVNPESAADEAGLQAGDVITHINGNKVRSTPELQEQVALYRPGNPIDVKYIRGGREFSGSVVLRNQNNAKSLLHKKDSKLLANLGFELRDLYDNEKRKLKRSGGVLVVSILRGSKIDQTNMDPGFVITKLNEVPVQSIEGFLKRLEKTQGKVVLEGIYEDYPGDYYYAFRK